MLQSSPVLILFKRTISTLAIARRLEPSQFIPLPIGSVQPKGWLLAILQRQRDGLCGHLGEISVWLQKDDNAWLSKDGKGQIWLGGSALLAARLHPSRLSFQRPENDRRKPDVDRRRPPQPAARRRFRPGPTFDDDGIARFLGEHAHDVLPGNLL